jgi:hypothetical protein
VTGSHNEQRDEQITSFSVCGCGEPLIPTFHWRGKELLCLECGGLYGMFDAPSRDATPRLRKRYRSLSAEWAQIGPKLLTRSASHVGCPKCESGKEGYHIDHATDQERADHESAMAVLLDRIEAGKTRQARKRVAS